MLVGLGKIGLEAAGPAGSTGWLLASGAVGSAPSPQVMIGLGGTRLQPHGLLQVGHRFPQLDNGRVSHGSFLWGTALTGYFALDEALQLAQEIRHRRLYLPSDTSAATCSKSSLHVAGKAWRVHQRRA